MTKKSQTCNPQDLYNLYMYMSKVKVACNIKRSITYIIFFLPYRTVYV